MPRYRMITLTRPAPGREEEYHRWYQDVHLPQAMGFPGIVAAQRFRVERVVAGEVGFPYVAIYEIETDDIDAALGALNEAVANGGLTMSDAVDASEAFGFVCEEIGARVSAP